MPARSRRCAARFRRATSSCRSVLHAAAWVLMIAAMMLPTTFPLLAMFRRITGARPDAGRLVALVVLGFFAAWLAFGIAAHAVDAALRWVAARNGWFVANGWMVGAAVLAGAGLFQWSALKYRCLEECRTPFGFVAVALARALARRARRCASASTTASSASVAAGR